MSLYRKYRPQTFEDVVGQEHIAQTLRNALSSEPLRVAHAYLFCGPRGTGKTTSARLLAKCLNCAQGPTPTPCNACDFCTRVATNQPTMDLVEIDAASNTGVDNVRENIIERVNVAPAQGRYRVYIIDEVHMLSASSFNALLKTLEEPPAHVVFVLATTDAHKVPPTILSRCQRFDFRRVGPSDIAKRLHHVAKSEKIALEDGAARLVAKTADGGLRDALTLLEQVSAFGGDSISEADVRLVLGTVSGELLTQIYDAVANREAVEVLNAIERATEDGVSFSQLTRDLVSYGRELLLLTVGFHDDAFLTASEKSSRRAHAETIGRARLMNLVEALRGAEKEMRQSTDQRLLLELALVRAASDEGAFATTAPKSVANGAANGTSNGAVVNGLRTAQKRARPAETLEHDAENVDKPAEKAESHTGKPETRTENLVGHTENVVQDAENVESVTENAVQAAETSEHVAENVEEVAETSPEVVEDAEDVVPVVTPSKKRGRRIHNLEEFVELWPAVLVRVKKKIGVTAVAYLHDARPIALDERDATLEFQKEFHFAKACEAAKRLPFEQVLNECLAAPHTLKMVLKEKKPVAKAPEPEPTPHDDDDDEGDIFSQAQTMFGAEIVARSGQE